MKNGDYMNDFRRLIGKAKDRLNILEEEVDVEVCKEYFELVRRIPAGSDEFKRLSRTYVENINDLFSDDTGIAEKQRMLAVLAQLADVTVYRTLEYFSKQDTPLKAWGVVALQQARMLLSATLLDEQEIFISSGLGGKDGCLRYFCAFSYREEGELPEFQYKTLVKETELALSSAGGGAESWETMSGFATVIALLPVDADIKSIFDKIISECNNYGQFLKDRVIITNVKKLSYKELSEISD